MNRTEMLDMMEKFLAAWNTQDVETVLDMYSDDVVFRDPNTRGEISGKDGLRRYLPKLFALWTMTWTVREAHLFEGGDGCALLWHATFKRIEGEKVVEADGMDLVLVRDGRICRNDVNFDRTTLADLME